MKVLVTKTSDWDFNEVREYRSLEKCVEALLEECRISTINSDYFGEFLPALVISKVEEWKKDAYGDCDYEVEIYDDWRE